MEAIDLLEKRIDSLTRMLGGPEGIENAIASGSSDAAKTENIVDSLLSANTLLHEATGTGREQVSKCVARAPELEKYLDPNFLDEHQELQSKEVYLNAIAPDLHAQCEQLERIKLLEPTLGAEYFRNIPIESLDKLKQISTDNNEFAQQCELIEESLILAMKRYGEIQGGLHKSLDAMTKRIEDLQEKMQQKKKAELEKEIPPAAEQ